MLPLRFRFPARLPARSVLAGLEEAFTLRSEPPSLTSRCYLDTADWRVHSGGWILEAEAPRSADFSRAEPVGSPGPDPSGGPVGGPVDGGEIVDPVGGPVGGGEIVLTLLDRGSEAVLATARVAALPSYSTDLPKSPPWAAVAEAVEPRRLLLQGQMDSRIQRLAVLNPDRKTTARVILERHLIGAPQARHHQLRTATVIPIRGYLRTAGRVGEVLTRSGAQARHESILAAACRIEGRPAPGTKLGPGVPLRRSLQAVRAVGAIMERLREHVLANEAGTRAQLDVEFLHDFRVAIRRARSLLKRTEGVLPPPASEELAGELQWLAGLTGPVRDDDVYLEELGPPGDDELDPLRVHLEQRRSEAQAALVAALDSERYAMLLEKWRLIGGGAADLDSAPLAHRPAGEVSDFFISRAYRRILRRGEAIGTDSPPEALHDLRKRAKELRYLLECFQTLYPDDARSVAVKELKALQDNLGEYQDCQVQAAALQSMAEEMLGAGRATAATLMAMGRLADEQVRREMRARSEFHERFARFSSKANRERMAALVSSGHGGGGPSEGEDLPL